jgi:la-related protein 1
LSSFLEFYYYPTLQFEQFGGMPFLTHAPPPTMFFPVPETPESPAETTSAELPLTSLILKQIEYYFRWFFISYLACPHIMG